MTNQRRLGRGLEALLGRPADTTGETNLAETDQQHPDPTLSVSPEQAADADGLVSLSVYEVDANAFQPRQDFDETEIESLSASLKDHGLLQPIVVRKNGERFELISGERRLRAAIKAGWSTVSAQIREADDREVAELAIVENLQRKDLSPLEKAASFQAYVERYGCRNDELAKRINVDRSTVANLIRLLELPSEVQQSLRKGFITQGHARALLPLGEEREQVEFGDRIVREQLSVRDTEEMVQQAIQHADQEPLAVVGEGGAPTKPRPRSRHLMSLEQQLRSSLGAKVDIRTATKGRGKIVIHFKSDDEFERIRQILSDDHEDHHRNEAG